MKAHKALFLGVVMFAAGRSGQSAEPIRIVEQGRARAVVVVPTNCDEQTKAAAELLIRYVRESSAATLPIEEESSPGTSALSVKIHVGAGSYVKKQKLDPTDLDDDGDSCRRRQAAGEEGPADRPCRRLLHRRGSPHR